MLFEQAVVHFEVERRSIAVDLVIFQQKFSSGQLAIASEVLHQLSNVGGCVVYVDCLEKELSRVF